MTFVLEVVYFLCISILEIIALTFFKFYYLPFIISAGIWPGLATVEKQIATLAAIIEIWRKQGAKPR